MTAAQLEHVNVSVTDPDATAKWMCDIFDWHIRWTGGSRDVGYSVHVGTDARYVALYAPKDGGLKERPDTYTTRGGLNHVAVVVNDIQAMRTRVKDIGFIPGEHFDYEPGQRFYFYDHDGIEYEVVQYD